MNGTKLNFAKTAGSVFVAIAIFAGPAALTSVVGERVISGVVYAQEGEKKSSANVKTRRTPALRERSYKKLGEAQEQMEANKYNEALQILQDYLKEEGLNSYEIAMGWQFIAYCYNGMENYAKGIEAFKKVLAQPEIPEAMEQQSLFALAQLYLVTEKVNESIATFKKWFAIVQNPPASSYIYLAQAYFQIEKYKEAVGETEKAMAVARTTGEVPKELWLQLLRAGYLELNNPPKVIEALEMLVKLYPKGDYFAHLSNLYGDRGDEKKQLLTLEGGYDGGYLSKQHQLLALASLLLNNDVPYKAAKVLSEGMQKQVVEETVANLRILAQAWLLAQEPRESIKVLQKAAKKSDDGELYIRLGQSYADLDEWTNCINSIRAGLKKGGVDRPDSANVTLGVCLYNNDELDSAIVAFDNASKDERSKKFSRQWVQFLKGEKDRRQRIANSLL